MRTTLTLEDDIAKALKKIAYRSGQSFKSTVNQALKVGLEYLDTPPQAKPYRLEPVSLGEVMPGVELDKALQLADRFEDEEIIRKLEMRK